MTETTMLVDLVEGLAEETRDFIDERLAPLCKSIEQMERRLEQVEKRPLPKYRGIFIPGETYPENSMVTSDGSLWLCHRDTCDKPGSGDAWTLVAKRGRDGRDAR